VKDYPLLSSLDHPEHIKDLTFEELKQLAEEIRLYIIQTVSKNGGHLASNLGVVELTIAMHRVFRSPRDKFIWDVGHQCYTHKLLTGRAHEFKSLRQKDGLSGFPKREESFHDHFNTGHASTSISAGLGILAGERLQGMDGKVLAVIGDGALTGGQALEALNFGGHFKKDMVVVLNDNKMSIGPNVGALSSYLSRLASTGGYLRIRNIIDRIILFIPFFGKSLLKFVYRLKRGVKGTVYKENLFTDMGYKYIGPIDGHNISKLCEVFENVRAMDVPVVIHVITRKGKGYVHAEGDPSSYHGVKPFVVETGKVDPSLKVDSESLSMTQAFSQALLTLGEKDPAITAITAAMSSGTGMNSFREKFPHRFFDVGIAEQHAVTFAAGLAAVGMKPVLAIYSTFMQRSVDQVIHDVALPGLPVIICMDRSGLVGDDGETHQGIFDIPLYKSVPGLYFLAPVSKNEMDLMLEWAVNQNKPILMRYPKDLCFSDEYIPEEAITPGRGVMLRKQENASILFLSLGGLLQEVMGAADILEAKGLTVDIHYLRFIRPLDYSYLSTLIAGYDMAIFVEEGIQSGGLGEELSAMLKDNNTETLFHYYGVPSEYLSQASRKELIAESKLDRKSLADKVEAIRQELSFNKVLDMVRNDKWKTHNI